MQQAQRRAYGRRATPAVAVLITVLAAAGLSGCTGSDSKPDKGSGTSDDSGTAVAAEPGRYRTLPEACGAVGEKTLRTLLPGGEESDKAYEGTAAVTYDIDRRDGCRWKLATAGGTRYLTVDFERVVSYDPTVSDEDRAQETYEKKAVAAHIPDAPSTPSAPSSGSPEEGASGGSDSPSPDSSESGKGGDTAGKGGASSDTAGKAPGGDETPGSGSASGSASDGPGDDESAGSDESDSASDLTAPRRLGDLADDAFLNDQLITKDSGIHRDITVVFRSSNVIATIQYDQWTTNKKHIPDSEELQENAQDLAQELTGRLNE
ncbi:DUF3558 domain-containing protein [Streptomyces sp. NPDC005322]|uniref:DUF3558 domain-containing protein n=1 Tax=unclassified Streptomyces TaxID=2593676 RepID=UPI0033A28DF0